MNRARRIGILGGTFDPIHLGHLAAAAAARSALALDEVRVTPDHDPPHRPAQPGVSGFHRFAMAALATAGDEGLTVSDIELATEGPSYTASTLRRLLAQGHAPVELFFITGADAFAEIETWRDYPTILDLCQFVAISRPGWPVHRLTTILPRLAPRMRVIESAEDSRALLPDVLRLPVYLVDRATPDVSSTGIRQRMRERRPLAGFVPPAVEHYILRHGLYR